MSFEPYIRENAGSHLELDGVTINKKGYIYFNGGFRRKYNPMQYTVADLFQDNTKRLIAFRLGNGERNEHNAKVRKNGKGGFIASASFIRLAQDYRYPTGCNLPVIEHDGLLVVLKTNASPNNQENGREGSADV